MNNAQVPRHKFERGCLSVKEASNSWSLGLAVTLPRQVLEAPVRNEIMYNKLPRKQVKKAKVMSLSVLMNA